MANMTTQEILQGIKGWAAPKVIYDISAAHNNTKYTDLADALGTNGGNIPQEYRKGGITVRFVRTYDNKYIQYFLTKDEWSVNKADWQKMNLEDELNQLGEKVRDIDNEIGKEYAFEESARSGNIPFALKTGNKIRINNLSSDSVYFRLRKIAGSGGDEQTINNIGSNKSKEIIVNDNYLYLYYYANTDGIDSVFNVKVYGIKDDVDLLEDRVDVLEETIGKELNYNESAQGGFLSFAVQNGNKFTITNLLASGKSMSFKLYKQADVSQEYQNIGTIDGGGSKEVTTNSSYSYLYYYNNTSGINAEFKVIFKGVVDDIDALQVELDSTKDSVDVLEEKVDDLESVVGNETNYSYSERQKNIPFAVQSGDKFTITNLLESGKTIMFALRKQASSGGEEQSIGIIDGGGSKEVTVNSTYNYLSYYNNTSDINTEFKVTIKGLVNDVSEIKENIDSIDDTLDNLTRYDVAKGTMSESSINSSSDDYYVGYNRKKGRNKAINKITDNILAINHDDMKMNDMVAVRKLYNKYGFNASFNFILRPFESLEEQEQMIYNVKELVKDGNEVGLHAFFNSTYWFANKAFDVTAGGSPLFISRAWFYGPNNDGTGTNAFGQSITATTKASELRYNSQIVFRNLPGTLDCNVVDFKTDLYKYVGIIAYYTVAFRRDELSGIDLNGNVVTKSSLGWAEYWYNNLVDNTLGYSTTSGSRNAQYTADYEVPSGATLANYYPDKNHILNGKMVFFDDTAGITEHGALLKTDPSFTADSYQIVGRVKSGLFKGCASYLNAEVTDRIFEVALAFVQHYYGIDGFTSYSRHGSYFAYCWFNDANGVEYEDGDKQIMESGHGAMYRSRLGKFLSNLDIATMYGIKMTNNDNPVATIYQGQFKLYKGQRDFDGPYYNIAQIISWINLFYTSSENEEMDYATYESFAAAHKDDMFKWAWDNAGQTITGTGGSTATMSDIMKRIFSQLRTDLGTGKVTTVSVDSINKNPSICAAVELLLQFCWKHDITVMPMERAREVCCQDYKRDNYFPNSGFNNILREEMPNNTDIDSALPNGWRFMNNSANYSVTIGTDTIANLTRRTFIVGSTSGRNHVELKIYGLPAGKYRFECYTKTGDTSANPMLLYKVYNDSTLSAGVYSHRELLGQINKNAEWTLKYIDFEIEAPYHVNSRSNTAEIMLNGYNNNVAYLQLLMQAEEGKESGIAAPRIYPIS